MFGSVAVASRELIDVPDARLAVLDECRRQANAATARMVHAAAELVDERLSAAATCEGADAFAESCSALAEVAVALGCSHASAKAMVDTAQFLYFRAPRIDAVFRAGDLDYAKARTIAAVLGDACDATVTAVEGEVLAAATRLTPGPLRAAVWRAWMAIAPDEAAEVRAGKRRFERKVYVRRGDNGLSWLSACLTDLEGAEAAALIEELAGGVCPGDPRSMDNRRADALLALLHGEAVLRCQCGTDDCPRAGLSTGPRRGHLLQILVDIETLLGLARNPGTLPDGSPLDPELVRTLAEDATWQAILTEMSGLADTLHGSPELQPDPDPDPDHTVVHFLGRGRKHRPGSPPKHAPHPVLPAPIGIGARLEGIERSMRDRPVPVPDGHGGQSVPPPGALTYRPAAATADLVRAAFPTCTFPGCTVPSRRCEVDHQVPFDHDNPARGGWTIAGNLQPLCKRHHQLKTRRVWSCTNLGGGAVFWRSHSGLARITAPVTGGVAGRPVEQPATPVQTPVPESFADELPDNEALDLLYEPTWWEQHLPDADAPPPHDTELRERWREHHTITQRRYELAPPPF